MVAASFRRRLATIALLSCRQIWLSGPKRFPSSDEALNAAQPGYGNLVVVAGLASIGKTALWHTVERFAAARRFAIRGASATELEVGFPYGIVRQLYRGAASNEAQPSETIAPILGRATGLNNVADVLVMRDGSRDVPPLFGFVAPTQVGYVHLVGVRVCFTVSYSSLGTFSTRLTDLLGMPRSAYRCHEARATAGMPSCVAKQVTRPIGNREAPSPRVTAMNITIHGPSSHMTTRTHPRPSIATPSASRSATTSDMAGWRWTYGRPRRPPGTSIVLEPPAADPMGCGLVVPTVDFRASPFVLTRPYTPGRCDPRLQE